LPLGVPNVPPAPFETSWLDGGVSLLSHVPCSPWCEPSRRLASAIAAAYEDEHRGFMDRWRSAARAVHVLDDTGSVWTLRRYGDEVSWTGMDGPEVRSKTDASDLWALLPPMPSGREPSLWADHRGD